MWFARISIGLTDGKAFFQYNIVNVLQEELEIRSSI